MPIYEHMTEWAGKPVVEWQPGEALDEPEGNAYVLRLTWEEAEEGGITMADRLAAFLDTPGVEKVTDLLIGHWGMPDMSSPAAVIETLVAARDRVPNLMGLFLGDVIMEESEISWIEQSDVAPLFTAYPRLIHFGVRGGNNLSLGTNRHDRLQTLIVQTGGLDRGVLHQIWQSEFPALEHLELWLGDEGYGWTGSLEDLRPLFVGDLFPRLRYLGLRNSEISDEIAQALARSPLLARIEVLDLSLGTLGDAGAAALLESAAVRRLRKLDIHHHYCSDEMVQRLERLGIEVVASDRQEADQDDGEEWRYVAVGE